MSRLDEGPCGSPSTFTLISARPLPASKLRPSVPGPSCPVTTISFRSHPVTWMEPFGFSISTTPSGDAGRRSSTRPWAAAAPATARRATVPANTVLGIVLIPSSSAGGELHHPPQHIHLLSMRGGQQMVELRVARLLGQGDADVVQRLVDGLEVLVQGLLRLRREGGAARLDHRLQVLGGLHVLLLGLEQGVRLARGGGRDH